MTVLRPSKAGWLALGLAVASAAGLGVAVHRALQPAHAPVAEAPACSSCDARHARLATLRDQPAGETE